MSVHVDVDSRPVLEARGLLKEYDGTQALCWSDDSALEAIAGEIHAVVGENGAGKSTLMAILAGLVTRSAGTMHLAGGHYAPGNIAESRLHGVEIVLQEPGLIDGLTVSENFFLGRTAGDARLGFVHRRRGGREVRKTLAAIAPHVSPYAPAGTLSLEDQKLVELARAVHFSPKVLLIDEMSACLGKAGLERLFTVLREQSSKGVAVVYISHYLEEVKTLCDRVTVLRDGEVVATFPTADVDERRLTTLMVGRDIVNSLYRNDAAPRGGDNETVLSVRDLGLSGSYREISFDVRRGEILGISGLIGCGSDALARSLFGSLKPQTGTITLGGAPFVPHSPRDAIKRGVAYVPPDRDREALLLRLPISVNLMLPVLDRASRKGFYSGRRDAQIAQEQIRRLSIRCRSEKDVPLALSGGNRQKVVLAKWLLTNPDVLILHNPTRGIDVGAKAEIYQLMDELALQGKAIILISDELPELMGMSDRILVMRRGEAVHETSRDLAPTEDDLITHMV